MRIKRKDIKQWMQDYADAKNKDDSDKYSYGSRLKYLSVIKSIFHYAVHEVEVLEKNPADRLRVSEQDSVKKEIVKYYSLEELNKLLDFMKKYKHQKFESYQLYYMLMYFLSQTGLRISEALALKWSDIKGNQLTVERQTKRNKNNGLKITTLKNTSSYRTIAINEELVRELRKFRNKQNEMILGNDNFSKK